MVEIKLANRSVSATMDFVERVLFQFSFELKSLNLCFRPVLWFGKILQVKQPNFTHLSSKNIASLLIKKKTDPI